MRFGKGINAESAKKAEAKITSDLRRGEVPTFICKCNNFKPMVDRVILTNQRLLAMSAADGQVKYSVDRANIVAAVTKSGWSGGTLAITKPDGTSMVFKSMEVADVESIQGQLHSSDPAPTSGTPGSEEAVGDLNPDVTGEDASTEQTTTEAATRSGRTARWKDAAQGLANRAADEYKQATAEPLPPGHDAETHGRLLRKAQLVKHDMPGRTIELYERGFVRVVGLAGNLGKPTFDRLVSVTYRESTNTYTRDQSAVGSFLVTGLSLGMASNENVKAKTHGFLTVATEEAVFSGGVKPEDGRAFEALADGILKRSERESSPPAPAAVAALDIAEQIQKLADLHAAGILTDDEFSNKKADLLNRM